MTESIDVVVAVHHPLRRRLLELLALDGPATASHLADKTGQLVGNISHHLKMLGGAGLIEEAPELAKDRRERWWRSVPGGISWSITDAMGDPSAEALLAAAEQQNLAHHVSKVQQWLGGREAYPPAWLEAAFSTESWIEVTPTELSALNDAIGELLRPYAVDRSRAARPPAAPDDESRERVFVFAHGVPATP
ncbi:helix-turn-helix domain-containing protein [soil metagenome]